MKKQMIPGYVIFFLALVITVGSISFLGPCVHEDGSTGACFWAGRALLGLGLLLLVLSLLTVMLRQARTGLYLSIIAASVLGMLTPGTLIGLCRMSTMRCRAVMQPAMMILFAVAALTALWGLIACLRQAKGKG